MSENKYIDLTMDLTLAFSKFDPQKIAHFTPKLLGHVGTHIDMMNEPEISLDRFISKAHLIDVGDIYDREILLEDTQLKDIPLEPGNSVIFKTNWYI